VALRGGTTQDEQRPKVKRSYWIAGGVLVAVVLIVLFVPGIAETIEGGLLLFLAGWGR
jgi:hypothetical protein